MKKIVCVLVLYSFAVFAYSQSIIGTTTAKGGQECFYTYRFPAIKSTNGVTCTVNVINGRAKVKSLYVPYNASVSPFAVIWDNIDGNGIVSIHNPESGSTPQHIVRLTKQAQGETTTTISEKITSNKNVSGCNLVIKDTEVSNNATVVFTAEKKITITPNTYIRSGTRVSFFIVNPVAYRTNEIILEDNSGETSLDGSVSLPNSEILSQNYPNPFNNQTKIAYNIPEVRGNTYIQIFDVMGNLVKRIKIDQSGPNEIILDRSEVLPGIYTYSLIVDNQLVDTKRMTVGN